MAKKYPQMRALELGMYIDLSRDFINAFLGLIDIQISI
jgi:hypothetical protein